MKTLRTYKLRFSHFEMGMRIVSPCTIVLSINQDSNIVFSTLLGTMFLPSRS